MKYTDYSHQLRYRHDIILTLPDVLRYQWSIVIKGYVQLCFINHTQFKMKNTALEH